MIRIGRNSSNICATSSKFYAVLEEIVFLQTGDIFGRCWLKYRMESKCGRDTTFDRDLRIKPNMLVRETGTRRKGTNRGQRENLKTPIITPGRVKCGPIAIIATLTFDKSAQIFHVWQLVNI